MSTNLSQQHAGLPAPVTKALTAILAYLWDDEERHFNALPPETQTGHIFHSLVAVQRWLKDPARADREAFAAAQEAAHCRYNRQVKLRAKLLQRVERLAANIDSAIAGPGGTAGPEGRGWPLVERYLNDLRLIFDYIARLIQEVHRLAQERNVLTCGMTAETLGLDVGGMHLVVPAQQVENLEELADDTRKGG
jgi:hypothetical protein